MGKFFKINVLSIQLKKEMNQLHHFSPIIALLPSLVAMMLYASFEAFVQRFRDMSSEDPETVKVHLVLAPTGSGKTTRFIAGMVRKYPDVLFVLCLPRVLACNVANYLRREYRLEVCVKNGKRKGIPTADTQVLIMTYQSAVNAVVYGKINEYASGRQVSLIFDECHETCAQATLLFGVMTALFNKRPKILHSLICISATMDAEELSKRLGGIDPSHIQVSQIEAPAKSFEKGTTYVVPILVGNFMEDEQEEQEEQEPLHVMLINYCSIFEQHVIQFLEHSNLELYTSSVIICAGIKSANAIQERLSTNLVKGRKLPVIIWNTFVQSECPIEDKDLPKYHLIILGSHMKLASSITFSNLKLLFISKVMQVATQNLTNSTTVLNLGIIPNSVEQQSVGRGNRDCATEVFIFPIVFPAGVVHPPRLDYPPQEAVSPFMLDCIDARISGFSAKMTPFLDKYKMSKATATSLFYSHVPIDLLLAIHSYSGIKVSTENKPFRELSIKLLRAITHTATYMSNGGFLTIRRNQKTVRSDTEFGRLLGLFLLDVVNRLIGAPIERTDENWNSFFESRINIKKGVSDIRELILGDGLGRFTFNGEQSSISPQVLSRILNFTKRYETRIFPFFVKGCSKMFVMKPDDDTGKPTIGMSRFCLPVFLPFGSILTGAGDPVLPMFFLEIPHVEENDEKMDDLSTASGGCCAAPAQVIPTLRPYASGGGSAAPAIERPSQRLSVCGGSAERSEFLKFVKPFREAHVIEKLRDLMNCIPCNTEFTSESFLNPTKYAEHIVPENVKKYQTDLKAVNKKYSLLTFLEELGLMRMNPNEKYQRNF